MYLFINLLVILNMSHFSKIKTNITNLDTLTKTIHQLGFTSELIDNDNSSQYILNNVSNRSLLVYHSENHDKNNPICTFVWNQSEYSIVVDIQLWSIGMDFQYFIELLLQKYAYNMIMSRSLTNGFQAVEEKVQNDGSISLTLQRWSYS